MKLLLDEKVLVTETGTHSEPAVDKLLNKLVVKFTFSVESGKGVFKGVPVRP